MLLCDSNYDQNLERKNIITMLSKGVEGIIISPVNEYSDNIKLLLESGLQAVFIDSYPEVQNVNYVYVKHEKAAFLAAEYLIRNGHENILLLNGPYELSSSQHFLKGYRQAHLHYNIPLKNDFILYNKISIESGFKLIKKIYRKKSSISKISFTSIITLSDLLAIGVYEAAKELNFNIPDDYSIIGYDNVFATRYIHPPLTTVHQPKKSTGKYSITILLDKILNNTGEYKKIKIDPRLIVRESVKKI